MTKSVYRVYGIDNSSQQQNPISPVSYYQSTTSWLDDAPHNSENGLSEGTLSKCYGNKTNSKQELVSNEKDENTYMKQKGGTKVPSNSSQTVPDYPFSVARVWISVTLVIVINIIVVSVIGPLLSQYLFKYFLEKNMKFITTTLNSTNASSSCSGSTDSKNEVISSVQKQASSIYLYVNIITYIPAFFVCLFAGSISDFLGRKCLLICSVVGLLIKTSILCIVIKMKLDVQLIYIGAAVDGLLGSYVSTSLTVGAIITDITQDESGKAVRFAIIEGLVLVSSALIQLAVGYLIKSTGFFVPVLMCDCILIIPLLTIIFLLPETRPQKGTFSWNIWKHAKKTFGFYFSSAGGNRRRFQFIVGLSANFTIMFTMSGKITIEILYVLTRPICWTSVEIGIFNSVKMVVMSLAAVIVLRVARGRLSLEVIGIVCGISSIGGFVFFGFADSTLLLYLSALVEILYLTTLIPPKTILSQLATPGEQGALFSSMACTEAFAGMVASTVYILIYNATIDTFKGAAFMVIAGMCLLYTILLGIMICLRAPKQVDYEPNIDGPVHRKTGVSSNGDTSSRL